MAPVADEPSRVPGPAVSLHGYRDEDTLRVLVDGRPRVMRGRGRTAHRGSGRPCGRNHGELGLLLHRPPDEGRLGPLPLGRRDRGRLGLLPLGRRRPGPARSSSSGTLRHGVRLDLREGHRDPGRLGPLRGGRDEDRPGVAFVRSAARERRTPAEASNGTEPGPRRAGGHRLGDRTCAAPIPGPVAEVGDPQAQPEAEDEGHQAELRRPRTIGLRACSAARRRRG